MADPRISKWLARPAVSAAQRYGLAVVSVAAALGWAQAFLYFHLPQPFTAFALSAIAITYWYGGTMPGVFAAVLSLLVRGYYFEPEISTVSRVFYDLVFLIFALLMTRITRTRNELEVRVAERTAELTQANEDLKLEITERKRAEAELRESEEQWRDVFENNPTMYFMVDANGVVMAVNPFGAEQLGYNADELVGLPVLGVFYEPDREAVQRNVALCLKQLGRAMTWELRKVRKDRSMLWVRETAKAVARVNGPVILIACEDITEQKHAEEMLRQARGDLAHVNRVTTMGELTASLAHEVNQPIAAAVTNANTCLRWLTRDHPDLEEARAAAIRIVKDGTRAAEIISRIRLLFKKGTPQRELVDVNEVIREMMVLLRGEATRYAISFQTELAADLPQVMGDRVQLQQVFMNLMLNGIEAMKDVDGTRELAIKSQRGENEHILMSVSDTGVGLPSQQPDQIFDAFFTTKVQGTGMGLSISRSIVESHSGRLWAGDNSPRGASFYISLPTKIDVHE
jgi:PAS domain S-box-containing protein